MLPRATVGTEPCVVGHVQDPCWALPPVRQTREQRLIADQRLHGGQPRQLEGARRRTRREVLRHVNKASDTPLGGEIAKRQEFPERHQPVLVVVAAHAKGLVVASERHQGVEISPGAIGFRLDAIGAHQESLSRSEHVAKL